MRTSCLLPGLSIALLLTAASTVQGQTISYSLLGNVQRVGPIEQCLYTTNINHQWNLSHQYLTSPPALNRVIPLRDSTRIGIGELLVPGYLGAALGMVVGGGIFSNSDKYEDPFEQLVYTLVGAWAGTVIGSTIGVHVAGKKRGMTANGFFTLIGSVVGSVIPPGFIFAPVGASLVFTLNQQSTGTPATIPP